MQTQRIDVWAGSGGCDELGEIGIEIYKLTMCEIDIQWEAAIKHRMLSWCSVGDLEEWDGMVGGIPQEGGNIYILIADSLHCTTETNTTL